ncbi:hypothetical protein C8Q74DRAFT_675853 [Fomes fomentarius]|nr:hypothetical protein C8Q74DRAFT_675853 [Fomes fomentarius]
MNGAHPKFPSLHRSRKYAPRRSSRLSEGVTADRTPTDVTSLDGREINSESMSVPRKPALVAEKVTGNKPTLVSAWSRDSLQLTQLNEHTLNHQAVQTRMDPKGVVLHRRTSKNTCVPLEYDAWIYNPDVPPRDITEDMFLSNKDLVSRPRLRAVLLKSQAGSKLRYTVEPDKMSSGEALHNTDDLWELSHFTALTISDTVPMDTSLAPQPEERTNGRYVSRSTRRYAPY